MKIRYCRAVRDRFGCFVLLKQPDEHRSGWRIVRRAVQRHRSPLDANIKTLLSFETGYYIGCYITQRMTYMETGTGWIGKHIEHIILWLCRIIEGLIRLLLVPVFSIWPLWPGDCIPLIAVVTTKIAISPKNIDQKVSYEAILFGKYGKNGADKNIIWLAPVSQKF